MVADPLLEVIPLRLEKFAQNFLGRNRSEEMHVHRCRGLGFEIQNLRFTEKRIAFGGPVN
jgi:hypothetical protein